MNPLSKVIDFLIDYCQRHAHPVNAVLHIFGVPMAFWGIAQLFMGQPLMGFYMIVGGYFLQYLGHRAQGNEVGEVILIKKIWSRLTKSKSGGQA